MSADEYSVKNWITSWPSSRAGGRVRVMVSAMGVQSGGLGGRNGRQSVS